MDWRLGNTWGSATLDVEDQGIIRPTEASSRNQEARNLSCRSVRVQFPAPLAAIGALVEHCTANSTFGRQCRDATRERRNDTPMPDTCARKKIGTQANPRDVSC